MYCAISYFQFIEICPGYGSDMVLCRGENLVAFGLRSVINDNLHFCGTMHVQVGETDDCDRVM